MTPYATLLLFIAAAVGLVALIVGLNALLGPRPLAPAPDKLDPFECGAQPLQRANVRPLSIKYYPIAIFFLLFDVETVLLFIWASATADAALATLSLVSFLVFMALLAVAFAYLWKDGGLEWR
jgi:NADH-quinone oxidoreductase subunit A